MEKKEMSVWKVLLIIGSVFAGMIAVVAATLKLYSKYCLIDEPLLEDDEDEDTDDLLDLEDLDAMEALDASDAADADAAEEK